MHPKKTILFLSHEASFTGAPILLLHLISLLHARGNWRIRVLCVRGGPLMKEFEKYGSCFSLKPEDMYRERSTGRRIQNKLRFFLRLLRFIPVWSASDCVFNNTIGNGKVLRFFLRFRKLPVYSYVHELETSIRHAEQNGEASLTFELSRKILSPSSYNRDILMHIFRVPEEKTGILRYLIRSHLGEAERAKLGPLKAKAKSEFCSIHSIPPGARLVLGMGTYDHRKAVDYFAQAAAALRGQEVYFFWMGMSRDTAFRQQVEAFLKENSVSNFQYLGPQEHDLHHYLPFDLFFLSSREDPYPLVVLEAASLQIPSVCFRPSGGIVDFVTEETGWIVDEFSAEEAARVIATATPAALASKGQAAQEKVLRWHFNEQAIYDTFCAATGLK